MKRLLIPALALTDAILLAWVLSLWFTPQGVLRGVHWQAPPPLMPRLDPVPALPAAQVDPARFVATLERPLFVPTRRPPPPPAPASAPPAVDSLPPMRLMAVYGNAEGGGILAVVEGRVRRLKVGESLNGWAVGPVQRNSVELTRGSEVKIIEITRASDGEQALAAAAEGSASSSSVPPDAARQRELDERRRAAIRRNERRARSGLPPLALP